MSHGNGEGSTKVVVAALLGNVAIAACKFLAAMFSDSTAMLAEAVHSVSDSGNQVLLLIGMKMAARPADARYPFGRGSERYFWPFVVALLLFWGGGVFALYEGIHRMLHPGVAPTGRQLLWAYVVLGVSVIFELYSFSVAYGEYKKEHGRKSPREVIRESRDMTIPLVLMEDTAALVGLVVALVGIALAQFVHAPWMDGAASAAIGIVLCSVAVVIARQTHSLLIGTAATQEVQERAAEIIRGSPKVRSLVEMLTLHLGPDDVILAVKVGFDPDTRVQDVEELINEIERRIRAELPVMRRIFIEPDSVGDTPQKELKQEEKKG